MNGIVYNDIGVDKLVKLSNGQFTLSLPENILNGDDVFNPVNIDWLAYLRNVFFTSKNLNLFRFVNVNVVKNNNFDIHETPTYSNKERIVFISGDDLNIVAYRSSTYQVVTVASLVATEIVDIGALSFSDFTTVVSLANGLTSPQIKYITPIPNDTVTFSEIT